LRLTDGPGGAFLFGDLISFRTVLTAALLALPLAPLGAWDGARENGGDSLFDVKTARQLIRQDAIEKFGPKAGHFRYDARMVRAAKIAEARAQKHSVRRCWRYVKTALLEADVIDSYPKTAYAKQAGDELTSQHGFRRLPIRDPFKAPIGSVLVYGGSGPGHVEIRTKDGFVSDFESPTPSRRPLIGVYVKPSKQGGG